MNKIINTKVNPNSVDTAIEKAYNVEVTNIKFVKEMGKMETMILKTECKQTIEVLIEDNLYDVTILDVKFI